MSKEVSKAQSFETLLGLGCFNTPFSQGSKRSFEGVGPPLRGLGVCRLPPFHPKESPRGGGCDGVRLWPQIGVSSPPIALQPTGGPMYSQSPVARVSSSPAWMADASPTRAPPAGFDSSRPPNYNKSGLCIYLHFSYV